MARRANDNEARLVVLQRYLCKRKSCEICRKITELRKKVDAIASKSYNLRQKSARQR